MIFPTTFRKRLALTDRGFTIVELMIVVMVIAILATITSIGYNGILNQARLTKLSATISQWEDSLNVIEARSQKSTYDIYIEWTQATSMYVAEQLCLGKAEDYPNDWSVNYWEGECVNGRRDDGLDQLEFTHYLTDTKNITLPSAKSDIVGGSTRGIILLPTNRISYWVSGSKCFGTDIPGSQSDGGISCQRQLSYKRS